MLNAPQIQLASLAVRELRVALSNFFLYSSENSMVAQSLERLLEALGSLFDELSSVALGESEGRLVVEGVPLDERLTGSTNMLKDLFAGHKIHSLTFLKGVTADEVRTLFSLLKPKALPEGLTLSKAMAERSLEHLRVNEKMFVAVAEGEVVVSADSAAAGLPGEQNLQEALEALQYFLQIFNRVRPDGNKQEVARRLAENIGAWLPPAEGVPGAVPGGAAPPDAADPQPWRELRTGFLDLKKGLTSLRQPGQVQEAQVSLEDLLKKLVLLGESQGVAWEAEDGKAGAGEGTLPEEAPQSSVGPPVEEAAPPGADPVRDAVEAGAWEVFFDPETEERAGGELPALQEPEKAEAFEALWEKLWQGVFSGGEEPKTAALRHLNRVQWNRVPRALQMEGFRNLRRLLGEMREPLHYPAALALAQDWAAQELSSPDWGELLETVRLLVRLAETAPPLFEKQNHAARVSLETVFCEPVMESLFAGFREGEQGEGNFRALIRELGTRSAAFFFGKMEEEPLESPDWRKAVGVLNDFESRGLRVYESWLDFPEKRAEIEKFLEVFRVVAPSAEMEDYWIRHWNSFSPDAQAKILEVAGQWKRESFRPLLGRLLESPESPVAVRALKTLPRLGREGDGETVAAAVRKFPPHAKGREKFWVAACRALGEISDAASASVLMGWAEKYRFMESRRDRSLEVRRAAVEALGSFQSPLVRDFLKALRGEVEKDLKDDVEKALRSVEERLAGGG